MAVMPLQDVTGWKRAEIHLQQQTVPGPVSALPGIFMVYASFSLIEGQPLPSNLGRATIFRTLKVSTGRKK